MHLPNAGTLIAFPAVKKFEKVQQANPERCQLGNGQFKASLGEYNKVVEAEVGIGRASLEFKKQGERSAKTSPFTFMRVQAWASSH